VLLVVVVVVSVKLETWSLTRSAVERLTLHIGHSRDLARRAVVLLQSSQFCLRIAKRLQQVL
jgi:hypothetical protein